MTSNSQTREYRLYQRTGQFTYWCSTCDADFHGLRAAYRLWLHIDQHIAERQAAEAVARVAEAYWTIKEAEHAAQGETR